MEPPPLARLARGVDTYGWRDPEDHAFLGVAVYWADFCPLGSVFS